MIFKRGLNEDNAAPVFVVDCISESRGWSRPGMEGIEFSAPLYVYDSNHITSITATRQQKTNDGFNHVLVSDNVIESSFVSNRTAEITSQFPLYMTRSENGRRANFNELKLKELFSDVEQPKENQRKVYPEDIADYIYTSLHSPSYRRRYKEFLKTDFPRVPRPTSWSEFWRLVELGRSLRELHLMKSPVLDDLVTTYPVSGTDTVDKPAYTDEKVWINDTQYFGGVPETAWNFYIGGYQPAQKWLKDRKGRKLLNEDITHYQKIIKILLETDKIMHQIG